MGSRGGGAAARQLLRGLKDIEVEVVECGKLAAKQAVLLMRPEDMREVNISTSSVSTDIMDTFSRAAVLYATAHNLAVTSGIACSMVRDPEETLKDLGNKVIGVDKKEQMLLKLQADVKLILQCAVEKYGLPRVKAGGPSSSGKRIGGSDGDGGGDDSGGGEVDGGSDNSGSKSVMDTIQGWLSGSD